MERTTYRQSKIRSDSLSRAAAVAAPLAVMSARSLEKDQVALSQDHRWELPSGSTTYLCGGRWNSEDGSQTTNNVVTKDSQRPRCRISSRTCIGWYPTHKKMWIGTKQKQKQGTWPKQIVVKMWFSNEANLPMRIGLLDIIRTELKKEPYKLRERVVSCRLELSPKRKPLAKAHALFHKVLKEVKGDDQWNISNKLLCGKRHGCIILS